MLQPRGFLVARKYIYYAIDGPAPLAKMHLQRSRRIGMKESNEAANSNGELRFDRRCLTPGTLFMSDLEECMHHVACTKLVQYASTNPGLTVVVDGPSCVGEGEVNNSNSIAMETWDSNQLVTNSLK